MPDRTCSIDGCHGLTGVPGTARGWCRAHYQRWQRHGDPRGEHELRNKGRTCAVDGCGNPAKERGWCSKHYTRWLRHGSLAHPEPWARAAEGQRWCPDCETYKPVDEFGSDRTTRDGLKCYCKDCTCAQSAEWRRLNPEKARAQHDGREEYFRDAARRRRAVIKGRRHEPLSRLEIAERDGWRCQICGQRIGKRYTWPHPRSLSIDHIVPIAAGGDHVRSNVQATHLRCNLRKHTKGTDQLRLIG